MGALTPKTIDLTPLSPVLRALLSMPRALRYLGTGTFNYTTYY